MNSIKKQTSRSFWLAGLLLTSLVSGCSNNDNGTSTPVSSTIPTETATAVALDSPVVVTFSEEMDAATLTDQSFTVTGAGMATLTGVVTYDAPSKKASFTPSTNFRADTAYTATLTTAVTSASGIPLATDYVWSFNSALPVPLALSTSPRDKATAVAPNRRKVVVTFSEAMEEAKFTVDSFTVIDADANAVVGTVAYDGPTKTAIFIAGLDFTADKGHTVTLTTAVTSAAGIPLATDHVWTFTSGSALDLDTTAPTASTAPANGAANVLLNRSLTATFNEALDPATISASTFTLSTGGAAVSGAVSYSNRVAIFNPTEDLTGGTEYTATLTTIIADLAGNSLAEDIVWSFTIEATAVAGPDPVNLRTAGNFVILTKTGITNTGAHLSVITGNIGASPITAAAMDNVFCDEIEGTIYGSDATYTGSGTITCFAGAAADNTLVADAVLDMGTAIADAAGRTTPDFTELHAGDISGRILVPGLYKWSSGVLISTDVTLNGGPNDVWIFQIAQNVTQKNNSKILLAGGAEAKNIFWQVSGGVGVAIGTDAVFEGVVLAEKGITVNTNSEVNGRLLSQTAVTLDQDTITEPAL